MSSKARAKQKLIDSVTGVVLAGGKSTRMGTDKAFVRLHEKTLVEMCVAVLRQCFAHNIVIANCPEAFADLGLPVFPDEVFDLGPMGGLYTALRRAGTRLKPRSGRRESSALAHETSGKLTFSATDPHPTSTDAIFLVACDMPFLNANLIRDMASSLGDFDAVAAMATAVSEIGNEQIRKTPLTRPLPQGERRNEGKVARRKQIFSPLGGEDKGEGSSAVNKSTPAGRFEPLHAVYRRSVLRVVEAQIESGDYSVHKLFDKLRVKTLSEAELSRYPDWQRIFLNINTPEQLAQARRLLEERISHGK